MMPAMYMGLGLNCPGDPGCPGYVAPGSSDQIISLLNEILTNQTAAGVTVGAPVYPPVSSIPCDPGIDPTCERQGFSFSSIPVWAWGAGAFVLALAIFGARRR